MELGFFKGKSGHWLCPTEEGLIVINKDMDLKDGIKELEKENGDVREVTSEEGEYAGRTSFLVGFGSANTEIVNVKSIYVKRSVERASIKKMLKYVD